MNAAQLEAQAANAYQPPEPPTVLRLSKQTREQVATLKRRTQVRHMNVLCRWALCRSLEEPSDPPLTSGDVATEIEWNVFAGPGGTIWWDLVLEAAWRRGLKPGSADADALLRAHVARGMSYLVGDNEVRDVSGLGRLALSGSFGASGN